MSRSIRLAAQHRSKALMALKRQRFPSQKALQRNLGFSYTTVNRFFKSKPIDLGYFVEISEKLGLDWQEIGDLSEDAELLADEQEAAAPPAETQQQVAPLPAAPQAPAPAPTTPSHNLHRGFGVKRERFIGRDTQLAELHERLQQHDSVAIVGMGGAGKTELSIQYAWRHLHAYSGGACWLRAFDWKIKLVDFALSRFPNFRIPDGLALDARVDYCWRHWPPGNVLLVLDDVTDYHEQVRDSLPADSRFKVLMTTRQAFTDYVHPFPLGVLEPDDALELLNTLVQQQPERFKRQPDDARRLCKWLGYLPLGLELVGRYLNAEPDVSLQEMLLWLQHKALQHAALQREEVDPQKVMTAERGVEAAFALSWERLKPQSQRLGKMLSLFGLAPIPWEYAERAEQYRSQLAQSGEGFNRDSLRGARRELVYFHLLKQSAEKTYELHSLIRKFFQSKLEDSDVAAN